MGASVYCHPVKNSKIEFRIAKQIQILNDKNSKRLLSIRISDFEFVSNFVLRASGFLQLKIMMHSQVYS